MTRTTDRPMDDEAGGQQALPFAAAEASYAERKNLLGLAILRLDADAELAALLTWVFNVTKGGVEGSLAKSYVQLAARPWGLCCGVHKARTTVERAIRAGVLVCEPNRYACGGQRANAYRLDWDGIRSLLFPVRAPAQPVVRAGQGLVPAGHPLVPLGHTPVPTGQPYKEESFSLPSLDPLLEDDDVDDKRLSYSKKEGAASSCDPQALAEIECIWNLARDAYRELLDPPARLSADERREFVRVAWIVAGLYDRGEWLLDAARTAHARGNSATRTERMSFWKTLLANRTGDAALFWRRLDACDLPPSLRRRLDEQEARQQRTTDH